MTTEDIQEFQEIFFKEFGYRISDEKATEYATELINLVHATYVTTA